MTIEAQPEKPKLPAVIKAGMILRGGGVTGEVQRLEPPAPVYPEGFLPPEEAHRQARQILADAAESAQRLGQQAQQMGYDDGHKAGHQAGQQAATETWSGLLAAFRQQMEGLLAQRQAMLAAAEPDIVRLVLMATAKVIGREARHADLAAQVIARTLPRASDGTVVRIRVNPADHVHLAEIAAEPSKSMYVEVVPDEAVGVGGCVVECRLCTIDATFRTLFEEVARALMRDEPDRDPTVAAVMAELAVPRAAEAVSETVSEIETDHGFDLPGL